MTAYNSNISAAFELLSNEAMQMYYHLFPLPYDSYDSVLSPCP